MQALGQTLSVIAIAIGVGLLVAGAEVSPSVQLNVEGQVMQFQNFSNRDVEFFRGLAAALKGFGAGFLTLGICGLVVPWVNALVSGQRSAGDASFSTSSGPAR